jgi:hypothetical protein
LYRREWTRPPARLIGMLHIRFKTLKCIKKEDLGLDEAYLDVEADGQRQVVWGPKKMKRGQKRRVTEDGHEIVIGFRNELTVRLYDEDNGSHSGFDPDDLLGKKKVETTPGEYFAKFTRDGANYTLSYAIES